MADSDNSATVKVEQTTTLQATNTEDLFGNDAGAESQDVFAQLDTEEQDPFNDIGEEEIHTLKPTSEEEDFLADATQSAEIVPPQQDSHPSPPPPNELSAPSDHTQPGLTNEEPTANPEPGYTETHIQAGSASLDFSDLLAEFEAENELNSDAPLRLDYDQDVGLQNAAETLEQTAAENQARESSQNGVLEVPIAASVLFEDDSADPFAELSHQDQAETPSIPASPSPVPSLSIEHSQNDVRSAGLGIDAPGDTSFNSTFSDASNWLGDTTIDDSVQFLPREVGQTKAEEGHEPLDFEIPQGWYDDNGEWQWYTEEEKEQVKQTMLGQASWGVEEDHLTDHQAPVSDPSMGSYSPALQAGLSENAARRTPQPDTPSKFSSSSYDPYAPSTAYPSETSTAYPLSGTPLYTSSSAYEPYSGVSSNAPYSSSTDYTSTQAAGQSSRNNPYGPVSQQPFNSYTLTGQNTLDPYAPSADAQPSSNGFGFTARNGPSVAVKPAQPKPQPQRMASNAYDPPFLKPQKSFVRIASTIPPSISPSFAMLPAMPTSPPQASSTPPPPPSGPPRRAHNDGRPSSRGPTFAAPPKMSDRATTQIDRATPYDAPQQPPSANQGRGLNDGPDILSPPKLLQRPPPSAFDPPLPPQSFRAPSRTASAASHNTYNSSPQPPPGPPKFAAPPKASESPFAPTRPLSRGPPSRQPSPMFAARPPSRLNVNQYMRSPPDSSYSSGVEQLLSPPSMSEHLPDQQRRQSLENRRGSHGSHVDYRSYDPAQNQQDALRFEAGSAILPPVLSRRYDEDGEDGEANEELYSPVGDRQELHSATSGPPRSPAARSQHNATYGAFPPPVDTPSEDPYAPSSSSLGLSMRRSPKKTAHMPSYEPHVPTRQNVIDLTKDAYDPPRPNGDYSNDKYAPSASDTSPKKSQAYPPRTQPSRASTRSYEPSIYSPPSNTKPLSIPPSSNPYAPARTASPSQNSGYGFSPPANNYFQPMHTASQSADDTYIPQQVLEQRPVSEDPLGRTTLAARNTPIAVFGFGGTLITAFPGAAESGDFHKGHSRMPSYGYASGRGQLWIRSISEVAAPTALKIDSAFPGPLVFDSTTPNGAAGDKKKREAVLAYLNNRAEEIEKGLPYLKSSANKARREEEGRLVLIKILRALVIGEGNLAGSPQVADALRDAFYNPSALSVSTTAPVGTLSAGNFSSSLYPPVASSSSTPVATTSAHLTRISSLLAQGDKHEAALYAANNGLWSHALIISSHAGVDLWKEIIGRFVIAEIGDKTEGTAGIKASYLLSAGVNSSTVDELVKAATITEDPSNDQWREVIGSVLFNAKQGEHACLDDLGAKFASLGLNNAAHACFLLSPLSPFFDLTPAVHDKIIPLLNNVKDEEAIIFAEIAEYARSLVPTPKGQEAHFAALPQLLPYKSARAWKLAELGQVELAQKYCTAIEAGFKINKNLPSLLSPAYAASLEDLLERLTGSPSIDPPNALGSGRKNTKPAIDKIGSWFERGLTKFIAGEEGDGSAPKPTTQGKAAGPFAQFSSISTGSSAPSRNTSVADFSNNGQLGISRTTSPALTTTPQWGHPAIVPSHGNPSSSSSSSYGDQYNQYDSYGNAGSYTPHTGDHEQGMDTPLVYGQGRPQDGDDGEFINPMAQLNLGPSGPTSSSYEPQSNDKGKPAFEEDDEDDLGFGNAALSRDRTPRPPSRDDDDSKGKGKASAKDHKAEATKKSDTTPTAKPEQKSSWLGRIWGGKKDGEQPSGPVKANLGEESSMIFDPELKRWVVKGAKPEAAGPSAPAPPPRAQTASPSRSARPEAEHNNRAMSATPPSGHRPPPPSMSSINGPPPPSTGFAQGANGGIKRMKSSLHESVSAADLPSDPSPPLTADGPPSSGGPPRPPIGLGSAPPSRTSSSGVGPPSIDDLLSRPPSRRPASAAAKKGARNRYVDVFQQPEN
ncbi:uncharacterized protein I206_104266 [Kwoniella pini CBS 10737]|uniref:Protein transport protein sec16 n=1 Tax=Kwoniella pini CBS 10737 TaxID=1296096 RepID=A0A1B9I256_9TREE|nr:uncharacterized protein I206_04158 [Kwoniella pini CBS 10737]OCF49636.1 hypothetical protein I206_04158 [Kwoniella pini CBS 10737]